MEAPSFGERGLEILEGGRDESRLNDYGWQRTSSREVAFLGEKCSEMGRRRRTPCERKGGASWGVEL